MRRANTQPRLPRRTLLTAGLLLAVTLAGARPAAPQHRAKDASAGYEAVLTAVIPRIRFSLVVDTVVTDLDQRRFDAAVRTMDTRSDFLFNPFPEGFLVGASGDGRGPIGRRSGLESVGIYSGRMPDPDTLVLRLYRTEEPRGTDSIRVLVTAGMPRIIGVWLYHVSRRTRGWEAQLEKRWGID